MAQDHMDSHFDDTYDMEVSSPSDFLPSQAAEIFNGAVTQKNIHAIDSFESTVSDVVSDDGPMIRDVWVGLSDHVKFS